MVLIIFEALNTVFGIYSFIWRFVGAYLGAPNMVNWGIPERSIKTQFTIDALDLGQ